MRREWERPVGAGVGGVCGALDSYDVVINAGLGNSAWSGGSEWSDEAVVNKLTEWVYNGGALIGVNEPTAVAGYDNYFRMSHILGVDKDNGEKVCHGKFAFDVVKNYDINLDNVILNRKENIFVTSADTKVLLADGSHPILTVNDFGKGCGVYLSEFKFNLENTKFLHNLITSSSRYENDGLYVTDNFNTECTYFPESKKLVIINNSNEKQVASVKTDFGVEKLEIEAFDTVFVDL